jgi:2,4-dienoyl-CoA reductase-like NADH-dependent reductase (Old Yellow Enzyme family)
MQGLLPDCSHCTQVVDFAHSQGQKVAIQLAHAGRKASAVAPWLHAALVASELDGGWPSDVIAPSAIPYVDAMAHPRAMTTADIKATVRAFADAARRVLAAGVDVIEVHGCASPSARQYGHALTRLTARTGT